jgi:hypothetical protein
MSYKWKPSASQRREFAERMKDPEEQRAYDQRKVKKMLYDNWKDKDFVPTKEQHDFCMNHFELFSTFEEKNAHALVISAYSLNEKVNHNFIHIVNEKRRSQNTFL